MATKTHTKTKQRRSRCALAGGSVSVRIPQSDLLCLWAAVVLREPEPLTRLLKKLLKPAVVGLRRQNNPVSESAKPTSL